MMWNLDYKSIMQDNSSVIKDGTIILMHDIHEPSVKAAERIIPELINMGFKLVTVSEMAEAKNVTLQNASYNNFWQDILDEGLVPGYAGNSTLMQTLLTVQKIPAMVLRMEAAATAVKTIPTAVKMEAIPANNI